jgi:hypothetical protein
LGTTKLVDIFVPDFSEGLMMDALVLQRALGADRTRILPVSGFELDRGPDSQVEPMSLVPMATTAIFIERLFEHEALRSYSRRIFLPNPEWLSRRDVERARRTITEVWHKSRFSQTALATVFETQVHRYLGFTSFQGAPEVDSHDRIGHFAGKSKSRHTQDIVDLWLANPDWPSLTLQLFTPLGISIPRWIEAGGLRLYMGFLPAKEYHAEVRHHGIQLCTSQMEGFGHYINEARALGAVPIIVDAPPMNELIDASCGLLVPFERHASYNFGTRYFASQAAIGDAVRAVLAMPMAARRTMGARARDRYLAEQATFVGRLGSYLL